MKRVPRARFHLRILARLYEPVTTTIRLRFEFDPGFLLALLEMGSVTPSSEKLGNATPYANKNG